MKTFTLLISLFCIITLTNCKKEIGEKASYIQKDSIAIKIEITGKGNANDCETYNDFNNFFVRIEVTNTLNSALTFFIMRCSWIDSWIFDNDNLTFCFFGCDGNYPTKIELGPKKSIVFYGIVHPKDINATNRFKMGFVLFNKIDVKNLHKNPMLFSWVKLVKEKKIYWSNSVSLNYWNNEYFIEDDKTIKNQINEVIKGDCK